MAPSHRSENGGGDGNDEREEEEGEEMEREEEEDEEEPRLKYRRMGGSVPLLLSTDAAASIAVAERMIALGTHDGTVHILDFQGNQVKEFHAHTSTVNDLSFDSEGEYIGSCSDDGSIVINNLFMEETLKFDYHRPMKAIALDPDYSRKSSKRFVAGGLAGQFFLNAKNWLGFRDQVLHSGEGPIHAVKWRTTLIAWANDLGVKVYDMASEQHVSFIERTRGSPHPELLLPHLVWQDDSLLVIGWGTSVKIAAIKSNPARGTNKISAAMTRYVDIVASFQTTYFISGIAPYGESLLILAYIHEEQDDDRNVNGTIPSRQTMNNECCFLRTSQHYELDKAYEICVRRNLVREQVFFLGRMGNSKQALAVIINKLEDIEEAIEFVTTQNDDELWEELIKLCLQKAEMVGVLLEHTVGNLDPLYIVRIVPNGLEIPRLRDRLVKIITDYRTETSLRHGCNDILKADCVNLLFKYYKEAKHGVYLGSIEEEALSKRPNLNSSYEAERSSGVRTLDLKCKTRGGGRCCLCFDPFSLQNLSVVVFFCCHCYHVSCLMDASDSTNSDHNSSDEGNGTDEENNENRRGPHLRCVLCTTASG